jgi:hypothetical protein
MTIYIRFAGEPVFGNQAIAAIIGPRGYGAAQQLYDENIIDAPTVEAMNAYLVEQGAIAGAAAAEPFAQAAEGFADQAALQRSASEQAAIQAAAQKDLALSAAQTAMFNSPTYDTVAAGLAATAEGIDFLVYGPQRAFVTRYRKINGSAVYQDDVANGTRVNDTIFSLGGLADRAMSQWVHKGAGDYIPIVTAPSADGTGDVMLIGIRRSDGAYVSFATLDGPGMTTGVVNNLRGYINDWQYAGEGTKIPVIALGKHMVIYFDTVRGRLVSCDMLIEGDSGVSGGGSAAPTWPAMVPYSEAINAVIGYGQSNSVGAGGQPALSLTQPFSNITFTGGVKSSSPSDMAGFGPLIENNLGEDNAPVSIRGETILSVACNYAVHLASAYAGVDPSDFRIFACTAGQGGTAIAGLVKGTAPYNRLLAQATAARDNAVALGKKLVIQTVLWIQAETDCDQGTSTAAYLAHMLQLPIDLNADLKAITGQKSDVHILLTQPAYKAATNGGAVQLAQFYAVQRSPLIHFVSSTQHFDYYSDWLHLANTGHQQLAGYFGRAIYQLLIEQRVPDCLWPIEATAAGQQVRLRFDVPGNPVAVDLANLASTLNRGIKIVDDTGTPGLSSISAVGDVVTMTLDRDLGANPFLRYAIDYRGTGLGMSGGGSGNLRDSTPGTIITDGIEKPLWHLPPHFKLPILKLMS